MKYIYIINGCRDCDELKMKYRAYDVNYIERSGNRLSAPREEWDAIDTEAAARLEAAGGRYPVEVEA